jgi:hypothetical protein
VDHSAAWLAATVALPPWQWQPDDVAIAAQKPTKRIPKAPLAGAGLFVSWRR